MAIVDNDNDASIREVNQDGLIPTLEEVIAEHGKQHCICHGTCQEHTAGCWALKDWIENYDRGWLINAMNYPQSNGFVMELE